ncbi:MAG: hypothetical protein PVI55_02875 [Desulfobacterales bacterium]
MAGGSPFLPVLPLNQFATFLFTVQRLADERLALAINKGFNLLIFDPLSHMIVKGRCPERTEFRGRMRKTAKHPYQD